MDENEHPPKNWGDWRRCNLCSVVQPPRALEAECCIDRAWCQKVQSGEFLTGVKAADLTLSHVVQSPLATTLIEAKEEKTS